MLVPHGLFVIHIPKFTNNSPSSIEAPHVFQGGGAVTHRCWHSQTPPKRFSKHPPPPPHNSHRGY